MSHSQVSVIFNQYFHCLVYNLFVVASRLNIIRIFMVNLIITFFHVLCDNCGPKRVLSMQDTNHVHYVIIISYT